MKTLIILAALACLTACGSGGPTGDTPSSYSAVINWKDVGTFTGNEKVGAEWYVKTDKFNFRTYSSLTAKVGEPLKSKEYVNPYTHETDAVLLFSEEGVQLLK